MQYYAHLSICPKKLKIEARIQPINAITGVGLIWSKMGLGDRKPIGMRWSRECLLHSWKDISARQCAAPMHQEIYGYGGVRNI